MKLPAEWKDRLRYWTHALTEDLYRPLGEILFEGFVTPEQLSAGEALKRPFSPMPVGTEWGMQWEYAWMKSSITLPPEAEGERIVLDLNPGGESSVFVNGKAFGTRRAEWVSVPHHYIQDNILCESGKAGENYSLFLESYAGHYYPEGKFGGVGVGPVLPGSYGDPLAGKKRRQVGRSTFGIWNEEAYQLWLDVTVLTEIMENLSEGSLRAAKIARGLKDFTLAVDFEQPAERRRADYQKARELLRPLMQAQNGDSAPTFYGIGNSHLDVVWLWPFQETVRKTERTFAQQLRLLERYPDYRYLQSQPQTYQMCKEHYPELYERIKAAAKEGRWIVEGAMWVEPDTNMTSGESLIRQLLYGMRFFKEEFDVDCEILWLPDTFGYSAALPQILNGFGVKYLVTQKIFWSYNEGEQFPYHYFTWKGNDGSEITSFLPTSYTYKTNPAELMPLWENRVQKDDMDKFLLPYGYGDGGGGPTRDYIEFAMRQENLEGAPKFKMAHPLELFRDLEKDGGPEHKYTGELYFTAHRGVYTSQARVKWGNRKSELALREAECWSALADIAGKASYPAAQLEENWKKLLLNQFHDILPGSSIGRVYDETFTQHQEILAAAGEMAESARAALAEAGDGLCVYNSLSWGREALIELPASFKGAAKTAEGIALPCGEIGGRAVSLVPLPSMGRTVILPAEKSAPVENGVSLSLSAEGAMLENSKVRAKINACGEITSFILKQSGREFAAEPMNRLLFYKDVPRVFDAWDIDSPYEQQPVELSDKATLSLVSDSPLQCAIRVEKTVGESKFCQIISLAKDASRIEFDTTVDWKELHRLLKVSFPTGIQATEGYNEIQFGYMKRPTHRSRAYDKDRFEVCNHRYTALCDSAHGAAVLNDCKYGVSMLEGDIRLTLLRAPAAPEMRADNRTHRFTYAFTAWEGPFEGCDVVHQGYELNVPATVTPGTGKSDSFFAVRESCAVILDTLKRAEDGDGLIARLYESKGGERDAELALPAQLSSAALCRMNEDTLEALPVSQGRVKLHFKPFQVLTLRLR
ncbi:MAG: alpha-mannosidase [Provencibacterium sp.]|jgi:alpha-mannosidase|nr:alpha-mannosidase [Provencibacterium sp.]